METLPVGAIVRRRLDGAIGLILWHWGVYVGDNKVVHFNGQTKKERSAFIQIDSLESFGAGHQVILHRRPDSHHHGISIARKARQIQSMTENGFNGAYRFLFRNCQDFCQYCHKI